MDAPGIILLRDAYGMKGVEGGGFILCPLFERKCKAFVAASGVSNAAILTKLTNTAKLNIGVTIVIDSSQTLLIQKFSVAADWSTFTNRSDIYYRKKEIYRMLWQNVELTGHKVACASFGGPVAIIRDDAKIVKLRAESALPKLLIFSAAGVLVASVRWDRPGGRLISIGWTDEQILVCVMQDGNVYRYDIHGKLVAEQLSFGKECWEQGIAECLIWGNGLVCITEANQLYSITDLSSSQPQIVKLADPNLEEPPLCMAVLEPQHTASGYLEVLLAVDSSVLTVDESAVHNQYVPFGPLQKMAFSPNGNFISCFTHDGRLLVVSSDFSKIISEFNSESVLPPEQLVWCGMDSVLLYWEETLIMVGPDGDYIKYPYDEPLFLIPECDGVRILSNSYMEFVQRVPTSTVNIFEFGSILPAARLYDARDHFDRGDAKADEIMRSITAAGASAALSKAVELCIDAASHEFEFKLQESLLRAAAYGLAFCSNFPRHLYPDMCKKLRVLNAVRSPHIGMPLTINQFKALTPPLLIARLLNSHKHILAYHLSEYLGLSKAPVVVHWSCTNITLNPSIPDSTMLDMLLEKLKLCPGISCASIAAHALHSGRLKLAALLLDYEPRASEQVPLLVSMGEEERALTKAIDSGDTDLVYFTIFHLWQQKSAADFFRIVQSKTLARDLFIAYARENEVEVLKNFYLSVGKPQGTAELVLSEANNPNFRQGSSLQGPRMRLIEQAQDLYAQTKQHNFEAKVCEEHIRLLKFQQQLEGAVGRSCCLDSSVSDTIRTCFILGNEKVAHKVRIEFKVPEKRFYWLKVLALANSSNWEGLEKFSKEKKLAMGYKPFVRACIDHGQKDEAVKYIAKLSDPTERAEAYKEIGMEKEAEEAELQATKDGEIFGRIKSTFGTNKAAAALFDSIRDRLSLQT